ncbi:hypothetical protein [Pigmentibacter ruber]|uniref:hypothetical protein n=1 Tax=Pigmentibacter ruber TaxID=2683196 RepID=UPI00131EA059|nr:hypothetical protein [Pigmentibacter ruber]
MKINLFISNFKYKKEYLLLIKRGLMFLPLLLLVILINIISDPAGIYKNRSYEDGAAKILSLGSNLGNPQNVDDRLLQKYLIEKISNPINIMILGSSRTMQIGNNLFQKKYVLNNSVSGAVLEDFLGIFQCYYETNKFPKLLIIGLDPWLLNANSSDTNTRWFSIKNESILFAKNQLHYNSLYNSFYISDKIKNVISFKYFQASIKKIVKLFYHDKSSNNYFATKFNVADYPILLSDGRLSYGKNYRERSDDIILQSALDFANQKNVYNLGSFSEFGKDRVYLFEKLISFLKSKKVEIIFYIPPYHPETYKILVSRPDTKIILATQNYYSKIGKEYSIPVVGSNNPNEFNLTNSDFYDGMHANENGIFKVFKKDWAKILPILNKFDF